MFDEDWKKGGKLCTNVLCGIGGGGITRLILAESDHSYTGLRTVRDDHHQLPQRDTSIIARGSREIFGRVTLSNSSYMYTLNAFTAHVRIAATSTIFRNAVQYSRYSVDDRF